MILLYLDNQFLYGHLELHFYTDSLHKEKCFLYSRPSLSAPVSMSSHFLTPVKNKKCINIENIKNEWIGD